MRHPWPLSVNSSKLFTCRLDVKKEDALLEVKKKKKKKAII